MSPVEAAISGVLTAGLTASTIVLARMYVVTSRMGALIVKGLERDLARARGESKEYRALAYAALDQRALAAPACLDPKTVALVRLAVSNPEPHEAASAAMLACQRLKDRLGC